MAQYILRSSPPSPFGRKVKIAARLLGLMDQIEIVVADPSNPNDNVRQQNPLGKIPCLVPANGAPIYDSRVIVEYLDLTAGGGKIIPTETSARIAALTLQALADGLMDAALLRRREVLLPEAQKNAAWDSYQLDKVNRALAALEASPPSLDEILIGQITVACALGYLDFRFPGSWRDDHPKLVAWLDAFAAKVPAFAETAPH